MNSLFDLTGKKAIVTGGTRGLGHGMAEGLMEAGAAVVIFGTSKKVIEVAAQFEAKGYWCKGIAVDLADDRARQEAFDQAVALLGGLDILVNAAGIQRRHLISIRCQVKFSISLLIHKLFFPKNADNPRNGCFFHMQRLGNLRQPHFALPLRHFVHVQQIPQMCTSQLHVRSSFFAIEIL